MTNTTVTTLRKDIFTYAESCIKYNDIINVSTKNGNIVMLSEKEYNGLVATAELCAIPGMKESLIEGIKTPSSELVEFDLKEFNRNE